MTEAIDQIRRLLKKTKPKKKAPSHLLSSGSTLLNLACSDDPRGAYRKGHYYYLVGDSQSGKTWLAMSVFAEASINPRFAEHRLIYDGGEYGALMDISRFFGEGAANRIEPPAIDEDGKPKYSSTTGEFYFSLDDAVKQGPVIWVLDSMDSLDAQEDIDKFDERKEAARKGKEITGSYQLAKPKENSTSLRRVVNRLAKNGSILIIVSQTRDKIGFGFEKKTRGGGRALTFYATLEIWTSQVGKITKTVRGKKREQGVTVKARVKKNRISGKDRSVEFPIYHSVGIDDVGCLVDYLIEEKHWLKKGGGFSAPEIDFDGSREAIIHHIEQTSQERVVRRLAGEVWQEIEEATAVRRKSRY